ncbi:hypothetical protein KFL_000810050 [Klebsormidium nitens]|uniref:TLC domain-containing protein n=1 Tax=Klebsormidium nitens TaxID=105231 RepID=A0A1Y1HS53_KLENI|nr:hypothetical protein KFL_000810050 [Klebsormidium nitens]|eukprot:GAQ81464.1 hypothetical protein KFL_000810050 [Klebsormidium nitens]
MAEFGKAPLFSMTTATLPPQSFHYNASIAEWVPAAIFGAVASLSVFILSATYSPLLEAYRKLPPMKKTEWDNRMFSTTHSLFVTFAAISFFRSSLFLEPSLAKDDLVILRATPFTFAAFGLSLGYFLLDIAMMTFYYPALGGAEYLVHHVAAALAILTALVTGNGHVFIMIVFVTEMTTPFVNLRWYLSNSGLRQSVWYTINGVLLFVGWLTARVLVFLYLFWYMYDHRDELHVFTPTQKAALFGLPPIFFVLNLYWFLRILVGMLKLVFGPKAKRA